MLLMQLVFHSSARGPSGLMVRVYDYYSQGTWVQIPAESRIFPMDLTLTLSTKISLFMSAYCHLQ